MNGATPVAWAKISKSPNTNNIKINGIKNQSFAFHKKIISSLPSAVRKKNLFIKFIYL